jgi:hypothetical protein
MRCSTASRLSALPVLVENSGSPGAPARSVSQDFRIETVRGSSGVQRSLRPLPMVWTCGPRLRLMSAMVRELSSLVQTGLDREQQHGVVPPAGPARQVAGREQSIGFRFGEEGNEVALETMRCNGEDPLDRGGVFWVTQAGVVEQGVNRGEPRIAGPGAVVTVAIQMLQEPADQGHVEVGQVQVMWLLAGLGGGVAQQQPERVAVGSDRVGAHLPLLHQPVREERLQGRREGGHGCPPDWVFRWAAASSINSGAALRYQ